MTTALLNRTSLPSKYDKYEVEAVPGHMTKRNRLVIVEDISSFWRDHEVKWTYEGVRDIMTWCRLSPKPAAVGAPCLAVGSPWISANQYSTVGYGAAWSKWVRRRRCCKSNQHTRLNLHLNHQLRDTSRTDRIGYNDGLAVNVQFLSQESPVWLDIVDVWTPFFAKVAPGLSLDDHNTYYGANLFEQGLRGIWSSSSIVEEVVFITGYAGDLEVRAFRTPIPRKKRSMT